MGAYLTLKCLLRAHVVFDSRRYLAECGEECDPSDCGLIFYWADPSTTLEGGEDEINFPHQRASLPLMHSRPPRQSQVEK